jgi:uncharacterized membrane protein
VTTRYNLIAGQSIERIAALSDGVFAVAMTLLVLDLHAPAAATIHGESELWQALLALAPKVLIYLMSFLTLGIFWVGQQAQIHYLSHGNRDLTWLQLGFLFGISLMPFSTSFMAEFIDYRVALLLYWANILFLGVMLYASWRYAQHAKLLKSELSVEIACAIERRIPIGVSPASLSCSSITSSHRACGGVLELSSRVLEACDREKRFWNDVKIRSHDIAVRTASAGEPARP